MNNVFIQTSSSKLLLVSAILLLSSRGYGFLILILVLKERNPLDIAFRGLARLMEIRNGKVRNIGHLMMRNHEQDLSRLLLRGARKL